MSSITSPTPPDWYNKACTTRCEQRVDRALTQNSSNSVSLNDALWDNGQTLSYCFLDSCRGSLAQQTKVHQVVKEWEKCANIKFVHVGSQDATIRITFDDRQGSWSLLGKFVQNAVHGQPTMNFGWIGHNNVLSDIEKGVILHEFGHTLGLVHEHQSPAREGKLTFVEKPTVELFKSRGLTEEVIKKDILNVYNWEDVTNGPELDFKSVMMYFMPAKMNKQRIKVDPNTTLSELDKAYINLFYPFGDSSAAEEWTIAKALQVVGFDEETKQDLQDIYDSRAKNPDVYWKKMREKFREGCALRRAANSKARNPKRKGPPADSSPTPKKKVKSLTA